MGTFRYAFGNKPMWKRQQLRWTSTLAKPLQRRSSLCQKHGTSMFKSQTIQLSTMYLAPLCESLKIIVWWFQVSGGCPKPRRNFIGRTPSFSSCWGKTKRKDQTNMQRPPRGTSWRSIASLKAAMTFPRFSFTPECCKALRDNIGMSATIVGLA